jgi:xanthine dehydrogenase iron-sulfur cluster and FAD-binding subunit A
LEEAGILPGSRLLATPEEVAEQERVESERLAVQNAHLDGVLASLWSCNCCRTGNAMGSASGLCGACSVVAAQLRAERVMNDDVNGQSRRELVEQYLAAQP